MEGELDVVAMQSDIFTDLQDFHQPDTFPPSIDVLGKSFLCLVLARWCSFSVFSFLILYFLIWGIPEKGKRALADIADIEKLKKKKKNVNDFGRFWTKKVNTLNNTRLPLIKWQNSGVPLIISHKIKMIES